MKTEAEFEYNISKWKGNLLHIYFNFW
jgi:hypothetical protein